MNPKAPEMINVKIQKGEIFVKKVFCTYIKRIKIPIWLKEETIHLNFISLHRAAVDFRRRDMTCVSLWLKIFQQTHFHYKNTVIVFPFNISYYLLIIDCVSKQRYKTCKVSKHSTSYERVHCSHCFLVNSLIRE